MIIETTVAPYSQWCEETKQRITRDGVDVTNVVGMKIQIDTSQTKMQECGGRSWKVTEASRQETQRRTNMQEGVWACEHILILGD